MAHCRFQPPVGVGAQLRIVVLLLCHFLVLTDMAFQHQPPPPPLHRPQAEDHDEEGLRLLAGVSMKGRMRKKVC
jgi:hypothetical protein